MRGLIVTADDFGAAPEVNEAVEIAHHQGLLTTASLMVAGAAAADAVDRARRSPSLRVGLHLVLVEGRPWSPSAEVPDLVDAQGRFRTDMVRMAVDIFRRPSVRRQVAAEIAAQFAAFQATGLTLDHVTTHKHFHLHPTIAGLMIDIGGRFGLQAARSPVEPSDVLKLAEPQNRPAPFLAAGWARLSQRQLRAAGLLTPDQVFGLRWSGAMTTERFRGLLAHLPAGLSEIYFHPAIGDYAGGAPGYRYRDEYLALLDPEARRTVQDGGIRLGGFSDFVGGETCRA
jgi:hopanoid biosynthesis associated protein HpnK